MHMTILEARRIAEAPEKYSADERRQAFGRLQGAYEKNRDRERAALDRDLAQKIWNYYGDEIDPKAHAAAVDRAAEIGRQEDAKRSAALSPEAKADQHPFSGLRGDY